MMRRALFVAALVGLPIAMAEFVSALYGKLLLSFPMFLLMQLAVMACVGGMVFYIPRQAMRGGRASIFALKPYMPRPAYVLLLVIVCSAGAAAPVAVLLAAVGTKGSDAPETVIGLMFGGGWTVLLAASALCLRYARDPNSASRSEQKV